MRNLNAHRLLAGTTLNPGYLGALNIGNAKEILLRAARDDIRGALRTGLRTLQDQLIAQGIIEQSFLAKAATLPALRPRFRMQGSMKYRTLNDPAHPPQQQIDVDDGVYLPTSFVSAKGNLRPVLASKAFFRAVEKLLVPLCTRRGWTFDRSKPCCVRVCIGADAHVDLPLYAIPDEEFAQFAEDRAMLSKNYADSAADMELSEATYKALRTDHIMLARRDDDWLESDPRKIEDWFLDAIDDHDECVRRVSRYLKGWRDFQLTRSKISSIGLMACAVKTFDSLGGTLAHDRDDLALRAVAKALPLQFSGDIRNPVIPEQVLNADWTLDERRSYVGLAQTFATQLDAALNGTLHKEVALNHLRAVFGARVPNAPDLMVLDSKEDAVLAYPRARVAAPAVPRTTSG